MLTTLPNLLTFSRIVAIPLVIVTFYIPPPYGPWIGCALFALAAFTDWLDGRLARLWKQQSELGRFLDPIADKLLVVAVLFMLGALQLRRDPPPGTLALTVLYLLPALVIISREILVSGLRERHGGATARTSDLRHVHGRRRWRLRCFGRLRDGLHAGDVVTIYERNKSETGRRCSLLFPCSRQKFPCGSAKNFLLAAREIARNPG